MIKKEKITLTDRVLQYMKDFGSITSFEAFRDLGVTRLSAAIFNLRSQGYSISSNFETSKNRYGDKVSFARYILES